MSGIFSTGSAPKLLLPTVNQVFGNRFNTYKNQYKEIYDTSKSDLMFEEDLALTSMGLGIILNEGDAPAVDTFKQDYVKRYVHAVYGKATYITELALSDIKHATKISAQAAESMADSMNQTKETVAAALLNNATSTAQPYVGGDGVALLSASHPLGAGGGTQSNIASADLSETALEDAAIAISALRDSAGKRIALMPAKLIIPANSMFIAERILKSNLRSGTADNDINALNSMGIIPRVAINNYITDTDMWIIKTNLPEKQGFRHFQARDYALGMDNEFLTGNLVIKVTERYSFGFSDHRCAYGSMGV